MRICLIYDCLYPHTVGGAERWYRSVAERLVADGHEVTYLTLRQWERGRNAGFAGVHVRAVGPRMALYRRSGGRRIAPPLMFGAGVLWHLLRHRRYDAVHTASFPYFSLLAAGLARRPGGYVLVADWHEVWTRDYWREYLGTLAGTVGWAVQLLCARLEQRAFCFSELHARRLRDLGLRGSVSVLSGEYDGPLSMPGRAEEPEPLVVFAGRMIPEKRAPAVVGAVARARELMPELKAAVIGDGPDRDAVLAEISRFGLEGVVDAPGFVTADELRATLARAMCLLLPSRREGYGLVLIEAASHGTPTIVVADADNAAVELISDGENGFVAASAAPADLASAILRVRDMGPALRGDTAGWFRDNVLRLSLAGSLDTVTEAYRD
ncbi:MAG: glycosyltransferase [Acidobacteriota bacterium]|nr:glycosyltransferase [Acidobacteriota bacterium]